MRVHRYCDSKPQWSEEVIYIETAQDVFGTCHGETVAEMVRSRDVSSGDLYWTFITEVVEHIKQAISADSHSKPEDSPFNSKAFDGKSSHYCSGGIEAINVIEAYQLNFSLGNAIKYILRCGHKGSKADAIEDLRKAKAYLEREISRKERE